jgi:hypothetical protein
MIDVDQAMIDVYHVMIDVRASSWAFREWDDHRMLGAMTFPHDARCFFEHTCAAK